MHQAIKDMLAKYNCFSEQDYLNALKEIFQEIALLGLWRARFYEQAAFYGGSALRILHGLNRFSEDLDFTLLKPNSDFSLSDYNQAITDELCAFGFEVNFTVKDKNFESNIQSAFIKADSKKQLIVIQAPNQLTARLHHLHTIKIKMEVDINPPGKFSTEARTLLQPIPFSVKTLTLPDLFAGKAHAIICRPWVKRVKGRDWYDFVWYVVRQTPLNLIHLRERLIQSGAWNDGQNFTETDLSNLLKNKIDTTDFDNAKKDILPFINDPKAVELWSGAFFLELLKQLICM